MKRKQISVGAIHDVKYEQYSFEEQAVSNIS